MKKAVFSIVKNEKVFLPVWLKYYRQFFDESDIYILDNDSADGSVKDCNVIRVSNPYCFNVRWLLETVKAFQRKLLDRYDMVLFAEADEIVVGDFEKPVKRAVCCVGFDVIHNRTKEPTLDWQKPILKQRKYWIANPRFNKPLLSSIPLNWHYGFHGCEEKLSLDTDLVLIHLRKVDYEICKARWQDRKAWPRPPGQDKCLSSQWSDEIDFNLWFDENFGQRSVMPARFKDAV